MSLRDYFAAMAMQGWLSTFGAQDSLHPSEGTNPEQKMLAIARGSYAIADAMIAEREK